MEAKKYISLWVLRIRSLKQEKKKRKEKKIVSDRESFTPEIWNKKEKEKEKRTLNFRHHLSNPVKNIFEMYNFCSFGTTSTKSIGLYILMFYFFFLSYIKCSGSTMHSEICEMSVEMYLFDFFLSK